MRANTSIPYLALLTLLTAAPVAVAGQSVLVEVKTTAGDEVATIRTDSMRLLVPLHLEGSFLATGTYDYATAVPPPASGPGTRVMWYPEKAALRAGYVTGTQWDAASVGPTSTAFGYNTTASGNGSTAMGQYTAALGDFSTAFGSNTIAGGAFSTALGSLTVANGLYSTALGSYTTAQAYGSLLIGRYNVIQGSPGGWEASDPLFVAGNGTGEGSRANALTLYKDGNLTIAGTLTQNSDVRLKEGIEPLEGALSRVLQLTPIRYRFRPGTSRPGGAQIGLTAQDVQRLFPELVKQDGDGYLSLSYANLSAVLVKAVQEQQAEIETLKAHNRELESELAALRAIQSEMLHRLRRLEAGTGR